MSIYIPHLLKLQKIDEECDHLLHLIDETPRRENAFKENLNKTIKKYDQAKEKIKQLEMNIHKAELEVNDCSANILKLKRQQYETKKNEEFQLMGEEIKNFEEKLDEFETQELLLMEQLDIEKEDLEKLEKEKNEHSNRFDELILALNKSKDQSSEKLKGKKKTREEYIKKIDPDAQELYELIRKKYKNTIVQINDKSCAGCHMTIIPSTYHDALDMTTLTQCDNCGRIIYIEQNS